ncbi:MAG TPA: hypothetical protein VM681_08735 [Candidatus Thermoplasmatota archaeon]|nr:hypothetical protein [Candidatus Thermoplasmatota archaeon]
MTEYGLVACFSCKTPKGVDLSRKTTECNGCGRRLEIASLRILARAASVAELQEALARHNEARARGAQEGALLESQVVPRRAPGPPRDLEAVVARVPPRGGEAARALALARGLTEHAGAFGEDRFVEALASLGIAAEKGPGFLRRFLEEGSVVEARPGRYRAVPA